MADEINLAIDKAKEQLEYSQIHKDFQQIKFESVSRFLVNEEMRAKKNLHERTSMVLKQAKQYES